jgi:hypothetical protein
MPTKVGIHDCAGFRPRDPWMPTFVGKARGIGVAADAFHRLVRRIILAIFFVILSR